ncbi:MAG TPA: aliphatic sulfonate ABC transporter substrate-binding protein [Rhodocyclaceae bacterium]|nr:aliphatic sulfonate ABC transporter substrate-binding protein [Rhodocyclaceae bacterium]
MNRTISARRVLAGVLAAASLLAGSARAADETTVRIGYQKSSTLTLIAKTRGTLEKALAPLGVTIKWAEFTSGTPLLEAVNVGSIDVSADVADTVPVFAQAAGAQLTYLALETPSPEAQAIVVAKNSPITKLTDLKGKRIAVTKGAGVHLLITKALAGAGLSLKDVDLAYLQPPDARAAFERGSVDAWALWDPFFAELQKSSEVRVIADGKGITPYQRFYLAATSYATKRPDVLQAFFNDIAQTGKWAKQNPKAAAELIAPLIGTDAPTVERAIGRRSLDVRLVKNDVFEEQQKIADTFLSLGVLPAPVVTKNALLWAPK